MVNVTWLGKTDDWVDKNVGLTSSSGTNGQLSVGSVHRVSGLECDNLGPAELVEVKSHFCGGIFSGISSFLKFKETNHSHLKAT